MWTFIKASVDTLTLAGLMRHYFSTEACQDREVARDRKSAYLTAMSTVGVVGALMLSFTLGGLVSPPTPATGASEVSRWKLEGYAWAATLNVAFSLGATLLSAFLVIVFAVTDELRVCYLVRQLSRVMGLPMLAVVACCITLFISNWLTVEITFVGIRSVVHFARFILVLSFLLGTIVGLVMLYVTWDLNRKQNAQGAEASLLAQSHHR